MGSAREVKTMLSHQAYRRVLEHFARKDWEIVAFDSKHLVLRIERENLKFDRQSGVIKERFKL